MRNPERIQRILKLIEDIWRLYPDTRFLQLIDNLTSQYNEKYNANLKKTVYEKEDWPEGNVTSYRETSFIDGFYLEDDKFEEFLKEHFEEMKRKTSSSEE